LGKSGRPAWRPPAGGAPAATRRFIFRDLNPSSPAAAQRAATLIYFSRFEPETAGRDQAVYFSGFEPSSPAAAQRAATPRLKTRSPLPTLPRARKTTIFQIDLSGRGDPLARRRRGSPAAGSAAWWRLPPAGRSASARGRAGWRRRQRVRDMLRPKLEVADIFRGHGEAWRLAPIRFTLAL
jgi:hypothetical protein